MHNRVVSDDQQRTVTVSLRAAANHRNLRPGWLCAVGHSAHADRVLCSQHDSSACGPGVFPGGWYGVSVVSGADHARCGAAAHHRVTGAPDRSAGNWFRHLLASRRFSSKAIDRMLPVRDAFCPRRSADPGLPYRVTEHRSARNVTPTPLKG